MEFKKEEEKNVKADKIIIIGAWYRYKSNILWEKWNNSEHTDDFARQMSNVFYYKFSAILDVLSLVYGNRDESVIDDYLYINHHNETIEDEYRKVMELGD